MSDTLRWQTIDTAPADEEILVFTRPWGPIIASYSEEFGAWLSRMQVPVSIKEEEELPTHWQPLPAPPEGVERLGEEPDRSSASSPSASPAEAPVHTPERPA